MAVRARIDVLSREVVFRPGNGFSPKEVSAQFAAFARGEIAQIDTDNTSTLGHALPHQTFVDGQSSDDLSKVRPNGTIVSEWTLTTEVVRYVWDQIQSAAPRKTGRFAKSQRIYADGVEVDTPEDAIGAQEVVIASTVPYARKIEGGFSKKGGVWATNPAGIYHAVAALAQAKFGNIAKVKFGAREVVGGSGALATWAAGHSAMIMHEAKRRKQHERDSRQPAVVISFR